MPNDRFYIQAGVDNEFLYNMYIYDRWGHLVFSGENLAVNDKNSGWDGTMNSKPLVDGVFVYLIEIAAQDNLKIAGDVVVVR